eukprot:scaffold249525_cov13-Tisochrysis_lutea.AAC.1
MVDHTSTTVCSHTMAALLQQLFNYLTCPHWSCPSSLENWVSPEALLCDCHTIAALFQRPPS